MHEPYQRLGAGGKSAGCQHDYTADYQTWRGPDGKTLKTAVNPQEEKYSALPKFGNGVCLAATRPEEEGRIAIVTNAGRAAVDAGHIGAKGLQGRQL